MAAAPVPPLISPAFSEITPFQRQKRWHLAEKMSIRRKGAGAGGGAGAQGPGAGKESAPHAPDRARLPLLRFRPGGVNQDIAT